MTTARAAAYEIVLLTSEDPYGMALTCLARSTVKMEVNRLAARLSYERANSGANHRHVALRRYGKDGELLDATLVVPAAHRRNRRLRA